jgi:hypothetical protein
MWTNKDDVALLNLINGTATLSDGICLINGNLNLPTRELLNRVRETMVKLDTERREALDIAQKALNLADQNGTDALQIARDYQEHLKQPSPVSYLAFLGRMR